jgi:Ni/Fe-hydrogenase 1 B-type cytochrome subunit
VNRPTIAEMYVWQIPVRVVHWAVAAAILVLTLTGIYIGNPYLHGGKFLMLYVKEWHLVFAIALTCAIAVRLSWLAIGNQWSSWRAFVPFATPEYLTRLKLTLQFWLFFGKPPKDVGHNPLAAAFYVAVFFCLFIEILTGFALNSITWGGWWSNVFGLIVVAFPANDVRLAHHMIMWMILAFVIVHVYSSVVVDIKESTGVLSSIVTGHKFERKA